MNKIVEIQRVSLLLPYNYTDTEVMANDNATFINQHKKDSDCDRSNGTGTIMAKNSHQIQHTSFVPEIYALL